MRQFESNVTEAAFSGPPVTAAGEPSPHSYRHAVACAIFALLLCAFWFAAKTNPIGSLPHFPAIFASFALMLSVLWFAGFGLADFVADHLISPASRVLGSSVLALPYLVSSIPQGQFQWRYFAALIAIPVAFSALLSLRVLPQRLTWQDTFTLVVLATALMTHSLSGAWPAKGLGSLPKLYLADVALYGFLVARRLEGVGYSFVPERTAFVNGARQWLYFAPIGIGLGLALHFIAFYPRIHSPLRGAAIFAGIFLLTAVPEEFFFRGVLQNLLEPLVGRTRALVVASVLFGLSHFPKGATFNWRYVLLATIAGIFYGRAWRARRQLLASSLTHAAVDTVWSLWFR